MHHHDPHLPRRFYPLRVLGMGLGGVVAAAVLWSRGASLGAWVSMALGSLVWPHVAYLLAKRSRNPHQAEIRNLLIDSAIIGAWVPLMHFNLLPSVMLCTLTVVDKLTTGIRGLWWRSLPGMLGAGAVMGAVQGFAWAPETTMPVIIACLPVLTLHTLSVSVVSYQLIRKVSLQNQQLDELRRVDALTGLYGRGHWQEQAELALQRLGSLQEPACMLMLDIDHFKPINDQHGHTVGDEVIRAVAHVVRSCVRTTDCAGRYGGDEFTILLPGMQTPGAMEIAQRIRQQVQALRLRDLPNLRITASMGIAAATPQHQSLRDWINTTDAALYTAKGAGRNCIAGAPEPA